LDASTAIKAKVIKTTGTNSEIKGEYGKLYLYASRLSNNVVVFILETQAVLTKTIDDIVHSIGSHGTLQNTATNENHKTNEGSSNCTKLKVSLKNYALSYQGTYQDIYQISDDLVGGKPSWISGSKAIWYTNNDWLIGPVSYLGDHIAYFHVDDTSRSVTNIHNIWQYWNGNSWIIPSDQNDVTITCLVNDTPHENELQNTASEENHQINDGSSNCSKLKVSLKNGALSSQGSYQDIYQISNDLVDGKPSWISGSGSKAVWYTNNDWLIGPLRHLGDHVADFHVDETSLNVTDNRNIWQYWNGNSWISSSDQNDVKVTCLENDTPNQNEQEHQNTGLYQKFEEYIFTNLQASQQLAGKKPNCINPR
jgi:hypothetical protein